MFHLLYTCNPEQKGTNYNLRLIMIVLIGKTETKRPEQSERPETIEKTLCIRETKRPEQSERPETIEKTLFTSGNKKKQPENLTP
jgi:hypothetical protein